MEWDESEGISSLLIGLPYFSRPPQSDAKAKFDLPDLTPKNISAGSVLSSRATHIKAMDRFASAGDCPHLLLSDGLLCVLLSVSIITRTMPVGQYQLSIYVAGSVSNTYSSDPLLSKS